MFIKNIKDFPSHELYKTNRLIGGYLISRGFPVLSIEDDKLYYFHVTYELELELTKIPWYLKPFLHIPKAFQ